MALVDQLDVRYLTESFNNGIGVMEIWRHELARLQKEDPTINFTHGVINSWKRKYYKPTKITRIPVFIWGVESAIPGGLPLFSGVETLTGDMMVVTDQHIPYDDTQLIPLIDATAKHRGIKSVILGGDLEHFDNFSPHKKRIVSRYDPKLSRRRVIEYLEHMTLTYEQVFIFPGNHDRWVLTRNEGVFLYSDYLSSILQSLTHAERLIISEYPQCFLKSGGEDWVIIHPGEYSSVPGTTGRNLMRKFEANIMLGHLHTNNLVYSANGKHVAITLGGVYLSNAFAYNDLYPSSKPAMKRGFGCIKDGLGTLFDCDRGMGEIVSI